MMQRLTSNFIFPNSTALRARCSEHLKHGLACRRGRIETVLMQK
jgi:hypothetical protein